MSRFDQFIEVILKHEGGYVNDPDDLGGETKYGITKRRYPDMNIKVLTKEKAKQIYYDDFYMKMHLQYIKDDSLALHLLDMGVNAGKRTAVKLLQVLLKDCVVDGQIGPVTGRKASSADVLVDLVDAYKAKRIEYYYKVSLLRNNQKFLKGWINRVYST